ncbi:ABC transporter ATP-binding protein [Streptomyces syringium]|uniref:ABC transporter ATP-binding protein n=1 Tax=Streptomyces syringium TaxID=76729 RepID=UPI00365AD8A4
MTLLPIASAKEVRSYARHLTLRHPTRLAGVLVLHGLAAVSGLVAPQLLGGVIEDAGHGVDRAGRTALLILMFVVVQSALVSTAAYASATLGEKVLATLREEFVGNVLALPLATVERAGTGDLVTRTTRDVDVLARTVRQAVPDTLIASVTILITLGALVMTSPLLVLPCLIAVPSLWLATRWYLARAREGYLRENATYSRITESLTETVDGARTVEALRLARRRLDQADADITEAYRAARYTLRLRTVFLPVSDVSYVLPVVATLVVGGLFHLHGRATLAEVTVATLYVQQLLGPVDQLLFWTGEIQVGGASLARLLGVDRRRHTTGPGPEPGTATPAEPGSLTVRSVRYAYRPGRDVLHGIDLDISPGERLAVVGPSGAGKSTLGRLLAGIHTPHSGSVSLAGTSLADLAPGELRHHVALVTQEHHVFRGTLRDNLLIAKADADDAELTAALKTVGATGWTAELGLDARIGSGAHALSPAQAQQLSLARLLLTNPHTLVLDEATSLIPPGAARQLERSLAAVLEGRTVIAIAHRLHTAHDADRIVVMEDGRISEIGPHDALVRQGGVYAGLWNSWHGRVTQG